MAGPRQTNTFIEGLQSLLQEVSRMKLIPDADLDFLGSVEDMVIARAKDIFMGQQATSSAASMGLPGQPGGGLEAAMMAAQPQSQEPMPVTPGGPPPGLQPLPPQIPESVTRMLRGTQ